MTFPADKKPRAQDFVGMPIGQARELADRHQLRHRVVKSDGRPFPVTEDYRPSRLNFTVNKGIVTEVTLG